MRYLLYILIIAGLLGGMASCEYAVVKPEKVEIPDSVSFTEDIMPVFEDNACAGCHKGGTPPDFSKNVYSNLTGASGGTSYIDTENPEESPLYVKLADEGHQNLDDQSIALILEWIKQGAPDNKK